MVYNNKQLKFHGPQSYSGHADQKHLSHWVRTLAACNLQKHAAI
jgi:hypothetical protein